MSRKIWNNFVISEWKRGDSTSLVDAASLGEESGERRGETLDFDLGERMWMGVRDVENALN